MFQLIIVVLSKLKVLGKTTSELFSQVASVSQAPLASETYGNAAIWLSTISLSVSK